MTTILIADSSKPSIVMTSEVIKDKIAGAVVIIAGTGKTCIDLAAETRPDMCVIDFDLPDVDGPALVHALRKVYQGPILMTAFPDDMVNEAVTKELYMCNDASGWVSKPVQFEELADKIDRFLIEKHRLGKRFDTSLGTQIVGKAAGRGKRAPKVKGKVVNLSLGGACIRLDGQFKLKKAQEFMVAIAFPKEGAIAKAAAKKVEKPKPGKGKGKVVKGKQARPATLPKIPTVETKFKARVAWISSDGQVGLEFGKLTEVQKRGLETYLRGATSMSPT